MRSYAEAHNLPIINWQEFLSRKTMKDYIPDEVKNALSFAMAWQTCAVGQCPVELLRNMNHQPGDAMLYDLGGEFSITIMGWNTSYFLNDETNFQRNRKLALNLLQKIDERVEYILKSNLPYQDQAG